MNEMKFEYIRAVHGSLIPLSAFVSTLGFYGFFAGAMWAFFVFAIFSSARRALAMDSWARNYFLVIATTNIATAALLVTVGQQYFEIIFPISIAFIMALLFINWKRLAALG